METTVDKEMKMIEVEKTEEDVLGKAGEVEDENLKTIEVRDMHMVEDEKVTKTVVEAVKKEKVDKGSSRGKNDHTAPDMYLQTPCGKNEPMPPDLYLQTPCSKNEHMPPDLYL